MKKTTTPAAATIETTANIYGGHDRHLVDGRIIRTTQDGDGEAINVYVFTDARTMTLDHAITMSPGVPAVVVEATIAALAATPTTSTLTPYQRAARLVGRR